MIYFYYLQNQDEFVTVDLEDYSRKYPCKQAWHDHYFLCSKYLPEPETYDWPWGIKLCLSDQCNIINLS